MNGESLEWEWESFSASALHAYENGSRAQASHLWFRAGEISSSFEDGDPRHAASMNNQAISDLNEEKHKKASTGFKAAQALWNDAASWTANMTVNPVARSSLFHLRMEDRHKEAFTTVRRSRWREVMGGAQALTDYNLAIALLFLDDDARADQLLIRAAEDRKNSCGANNPELAQIASVISGRQGATGQTTDAQKWAHEAETIMADPSRSSLDCWQDEQPADLCDGRRLLAATYLTAIVHERDFM